MANYYAYSRSSYFKVKNPEDYKKFCNKWGLTLINKEIDNETLYGFLSEMGDGGIPTHYYDEESGEYIDDYEGFLNELAQQLDPDWVAIFQEVGYEKLRYLVGSSLMIDSEGTITIVSIDDIYERVDIFKTDKKFTRCEY